VLAAISKSVGEHLLAAHLVAQPPEDNAAEGACHEGCGECSQQEQGLHGLVRLGQEDRPHRGDEVAKHADVVPFHRVADDRPAECFFQHGLVNDVDVGYFESTACWKFQF
jgi:hypothetical protein